MFFNPVLLHRGIPQTVLVDRITYVCKLLFLVTLEVKQDSGKLSRRGDLWELKFLREKKEVRYVEIKKANVKNRKSYVKDKKMLKIINQF